MTAVEFLLSELKKYGDTCPNYDINYVIEIPTHILTELQRQAKEMEKHEKIKFALNVCIERAQTHGGDALEIAKKLANL